MNARTGHPTPQEALNKLKDGNRRFTGNWREHPRADAARRESTAQTGQHPFAIVIGCSDSRCPIELIFDQGVGDLFVIRIAGNTCSKRVAGSVEYGIAELGCPLCVVLGHTKCGAVTAAVNGVQAGGHIAGLLEPIKQAVERVRAAHPGQSDAELVGEAVRENVRQAMADLLAASRIVEQAAADGQVMLLGAVYDIQTGLVDWLDPL